MLSRCAPAGLAAGSCFGVDHEPVPTYPLRQSGQGLSPGEPASPASKIETKQEAADTVCNTHLCTQISIAVALAPWFNNSQDVTLTNWLESMAADPRAELSLLQVSHC